MASVAGGAVMSVALGRGVMARRRAGVACYVGCAVGHRGVGPKEEERRKGKEGKKKRKEEKKRKREMRKKKIKEKGK
jgi:deoxyinosine 3'endonuclease (endonuclease V)